MKASNYKHIFKVIKLCFAISMQRVIEEYIFIWNEMRFRTFRKVIAWAWGFVFQILLKDWTVYLLIILIYSLIHF